MEGRFDKCRAEYVEVREKLIVFGDCRYWADVEADEATLAKLRPRTTSARKRAMWRIGSIGGWCGSDGSETRRGGSRSLWRFKVRFPGSGAMKVDW